MTAGLIQEGPHDYDHRLGPVERVEEKNGMCEPGMIGSGSPVKFGMCELMMTNSGPPWNDGMCERTKADSGSPVVEAGMREEDVMTASMNPGMNWWIVSYDHKSR